MEVHYMVREEDRYKFAAVMNLAHCFVWKYFHEKFGLEEVPVGRTYFDQLDSRHCVLKEHDEKLKTPSNPGGEEDKPKGIAIKPTDVEDLMKDLWEVD